MKRILITAGPVYGRLDDNKLVSNRSRGIWAIRFAEYLLKQGHRTTLLVSDTQAQMWGEVVGEKTTMHIVRHTGFEDYKAKCYEFAETHDAAVMAAAVVNWIPAEPIKGKMETHGFEEGDRIDIPFVLAPRVINQMRNVNPDLTLIGCKMLVGSERWKLQGAAHGLTLASRAHVVVANDLTSLHQKLLVYPDRTVREFNDEWDAMYGELLAVIEDEHWHTEHTPGVNAEQILSFPFARIVFDRVVDKYRDRFTQRDPSTAFGSLLVPVPPEEGGGYLISPRTKSGSFTSADAVFVPKIDVKNRTIYTGKGAKATMNAALLVRMAQWSQKKAQEGSCFAVPASPVLHLHEQVEGMPTQPYAPPGTDRDNLRTINSATINIEGHGFIALLDGSLGYWK